MSKEAIFLCAKDNIIPNTGVCALVADEQVALFRVVADGSEQFYAVQNHDPFSDANVLSRGLVCSINGVVCVASPIYKQHFDLASGQCIEDEDVCLKAWKVVIKDNDLYVEPQEKAIAA